MHFMSNATCVTGVMTPGWFLSLVSFQFIRLAARTIVN